MESGQPKLRQTKLQKCFTFVTVRKNPRRPTQKSAQNPFCKTFALTYLQGPASQWLPMPPFSWPCCMHPLHCTGVRAMDERATFVMLRCIHQEFTRQCHCHGPIVNLLYLLILSLSQTVEPQGLLDCSSVGFGFCFPAFLKYCHVSVFSRGMLALGSVLHVHPGGTHSNNMCKMLLKRVFCFFSKLGP